MSVNQIHSNISGHAGEELEERIKAPFLCFQIFINQYILIYIHIYIYIYIYIYITFHMLMLSLFQCLHSDFNVL